MARQTVESSPDPTSSTDMRRHLVVTVHGIRTFGQWQDRFRALVDSADSGITLRNYSYGYLSIIAFMIPPLRALVTRRFRYELLANIGNESWDRIDIIAHSFGTHIVAWALHGMPEAKRPQVHTMILAGSVLKSTFPWRDLLDHGVFRVVNECGVKDGVLLLNQIVVLFTGMAGRIGFVAMESDRFQNRFHQFGHSGYFKACDGGDDDDFMRTHWLPLTREDGAIEAIDHRPPANWRSGLSTFLLTNAEPIKLLIYISPIGALALIFFVMYQAERAATELATEKLFESYMNEGDAHANAGRWEASGEAFMAARSLYESIDPRTLRAELALWRRYYEFPPWIIPSCATATIRRVTSASSHRSLVEPADRDSAEGIEDNDLVEDWGIEPVVSPDGTHRLEGMRAPILYHPRDLRENNAVVVKEIQTGQIVRSFPWYGNRVTGGRFSADNDLVLLRDRSGNDELWETRQLDRRMLRQVNQGSSSLDISPDDYLAVSGYETNIMTVWDVATGQTLQEFVHEAVVTSAMFAPDARSVVTGDLMGTMKRWDVQTGHEIGTYTGHSAAVRALDYDPRSARLASAAADQEVRIWDLRTGVMLQTLTHGGAVCDVEFSPDGTQLAAASQDGRIVVWDIGTARRTRAWDSVAENGLPLCRWRPDGKCVIGVNGRDIIMWDVETAEAVKTFDGGYGVVDVAFLHVNSRILVSLHWDSTLAFWDTDTGEMVESFREQGEGGPSLAVAHGSLRIITLEEYAGCLLWDFAAALRHPQLQTRVREAAAELHANPDDASALRDFGEWLAFRGYDDWGSSLLMEARTKGADVSSLVLARCFWSGGNFGEARREFARALEDREAPEYYLQLCIEAVRRAEEATVPTSGRPD